MTDAIESFSTELADRILKGESLDLETIEKSYFLIKDRVAVTESEEKSKMWCKYIHEKLASVDLSKRNIAAMNKESLIREFYSLIAK